jgi:hypothetical protein
MRRMKLICISSRQEAATGLLRSRRPRAWRGSSTARNRPQYAGVSASSPPTARPLPAAAGTVLSICTAAAHPGSRGAGVLEQRCSGLKPCFAGGHHTIAAAPGDPSSDQNLVGRAERRLSFHKRLSERTVIWGMSVEGVTHCNLRRRLWIV